MRRIEDYILASKSDKLCIQDNYGQYSYIDVKQKVINFCNHFKRFNIDKGHVIVFLQNDARAVIATLSLINCNYSAAPVDIDTPSITLQSMIELLNAKAVIYNGDNQVIEQLKEIYRQVRFIEYSDSEIKQEVKKECSIIKNEDDIALILFTSGTSGNFKAVVHTHRSIMCNIDSVLDYMKTTEEDRFYIMKSYVHCSSIISEIFLAFTRGASICICNPKVAVSTIIKNIEKYKPTVIGMNPTLIRLLCNMKNVKESLKSVKIAISCGAAISNELIKECEKIFVDAYVINIYGLTEAGPRVSAQVPGEVNREGSVGKAIKDVIIKIADKGTYGEKEAGQILVKSPSLMLYYLNNEEETKKKLVDGWLYTGDIGYLDDDGYLYVLGRNDDIINRGGHNVAPIRVEKVVNEIEGVKQSLVFGVPNLMNGQNIICAIVAEAGVDIDSNTIFAHCNETLYGYECPQEILIWDKIPITESEKVSRKLAFDKYKKCKSDKKENL